MSSGRTAVRDRRGHDWVEDRPWDKPAVIAKLIAKRTGAARCRRCAVHIPSGRWATRVAACLWEWQGARGSHGITIDGIDLHVHEHEGHWLAGMRDERGFAEIGSRYISDQAARDACALTLGIGSVRHTWPAAAATSGC